MGGVSAKSTGASGGHLFRFLDRRLSTVVVQRFCKPKVGGSNPSAGTIFQIDHRTLVSYNTFLDEPFYAIQSVTK